MPHPALPSRECRQLSGNLSSMATERIRNARGQGTRLREDLVAAADRLLETVRGEEELSMRAVAREAGVAPQSVYLHFADKRALMSAVYDLRFGELVRTLEAAVGGIEDPRERLLAFAGAYCAYAEDNPGHYRVLFGTAGTPGWEPENMVGLDAFRLLREAIGACRSDRVDEAAVCFWAGLHGTVVLRRDRPSFPWPPLDDVLRTLVADHTRATGA
jgi:AcrR family transcriptional regulator